MVLGAVLDAEIAGVVGKGRPRLEWRQVVRRMCRVLGCICQTCWIGLSGE
jgi:hypothetical protein